MTYLIVEIGFRSPVGGPVESSGLRWFVSAPEGSLFHHLDSACIQAMNFYGVKSPEHLIPEFTATPFSSEHGKLWATGKVFKHGGYEFRRLWIPGNSDADRHPIDPQNDKPSAAG